MLVGDSLGVGTLPELRKLVPRISISSNVVIGRGSPDGVAALRRLITPSHDAVVFDLGSNDSSVDTLRASLRATLRIAGDRPLVIATVNGPKADAKNELIRDFAARNRLTLVDWALADPSLLSGDGLHPTGAGYAERAQAFAKAIR